MMRARFALFAAALVFAGTGLAWSAVGSAEQPAPDRPRMAPGYLPRNALPDSLGLNPPPAARGSAEEARDIAAARAALRLRGTARFEQAAIDADLFSPATTGVFSCAAGMPIGADTTPRINALMRRLAPDLAMAVYPTKTRFMRARPFTVNRKPTCTPQDEKMLASDGSYPSGHSAIGYGWGLVLAEVLPDRATRLVARGRAFGDSRRVCNVHWLSDVEEGRVVASAVVARLHAEPAFRADLDAARAEAEAVRGRLPAPDCTREDAALAIH